ncbi:MAG TPA: hypothetical protein VGL53_09215 [Bryobacteraceae bacterium]|jgi:hypothetical protein
MKSTIIRFAFCLTALIASTQVFAQSLGTVRVSVPFEFNVAGTQMPAGDYSIEETGAGGALLIQCLSTRRSIMVLSNPAAVPSGARGAGLTFERVNGTRILTKVMTDSAIARSLPNAH